MSAVRKPDDWLLHRMLIKLKKCGKIGVDEITKSKFWRMSTPANNKLAAWVADRVEHFGWSSSARSPRCARS
jgi:hypothetical protein